VKRGRPKSDKTTPAVAAGPRNQLLDRTRDLRTRPSKAASGRKSVVQKMLLADPNLTAADRRHIRQAGKTPLTVADLAELVAYQLAFVRRAYALGELTAKDTIVALGKIATQSNVAIQLGGGDDQGATSISVAFSLDGLPVAAAALKRPPQGPTGDVIDVEA